MKSKTLLLILCLSLVLLSLTSVSASDVDNMAVQSSDSDFITSDEISISDMEAIDESDLLNSAPFYDLQTIIDDADEDSEINLTTDYSLGDGGHTISIDKSLTINGNGHTLDGDYKDRLFEIKSDGKHLIFKNITFKCANITGDGSVIYNPHSTTSLNIYDCEFYENNAWGDGGAIYSKGNTFIANSTFKSNWGEGLGGAVYCKGKTGIVNSSFEDNHMYLNSSAFNGGAIYSVDNCEVDLSTFKSNYVMGDGGAIYCDAETYITRSEFSDNQASECESYGGAIRSNGGCYIESSTFKNNYAGAQGGAIYANHDLTIAGTKNEFTGNTAKYPDWGTIEDDGGAIYCCGILKLYNATLTGNDALLDGGAVYCEGDAIIEGCEFKENSATGSTHRCFGGAIRIKESLSIANCTFENNYADNWGGAIYADKDIIMFDCNFIGNHAKYAGAVYTSTILYNKIDNCTFIHNKATSGDGGAFYLNNECEPEFKSCIFENNTCTEKGGAIYISSSNAPITLSDCTFHNNNASEYGGAVYTGIMGKISGTTFTNNYAGENGGALYINNICDCEFISCRFQENTCTKKGGAIHSDATTTNLKIQYCTFVGNNGQHGKSIYNLGEYHSVDMCWFGTNNPNFSNEFIKGYVIGSDEEYEVTDHLKIEMKINADDFYLGNIYEVTFNFYATNGNEVKKDILHSEVTFQGWGWNSSDLEVDANEITFNVIFNSNLARIFAYLNDETLDLNLQVKNKTPSKVEILRCDNITFPDALIVEYKIINRTLLPSYIIKNNKGEIVKQGIAINNDPLVFDDLEPGLHYSITIINHESRTTLGSEATAYFNVKTTVVAVVSADNVTYGENTTITLQSNVDGLYNVSIGKLLIEMEVVNGTCVKPVMLKAGEYQTNTTFNNNFTLNCTEASFSVGKATPDFYLIPITSAEYIYGFTIIVGHSLMFSDATGYIIFTVNNETYSNRTTENDFYSDDLDLGSYLIGASYSGDSNYYPANAIPVKIKVVPADNNITVSADNVTYGENVTIAIVADYDGTYQLNVSGEIYNVTVYGNNGNISLSLNGGSYWANIIFNDPHYNANITNAQFNVFKQKATIIASNKAYVINYGGKYSVTLKDSNGNALVGKKIVFILNGKNIGSAKTNSRGIATIKMTAKMLKAAKAGKRNLVIKLDDTNYQAQKTVKITIKKEKSYIKAKSKSFKSNKNVKKYAITLKNSKGKAIKKAKVILKVKGKKYKAKTNTRGKAIFKITKLSKKGTYKASITYKGNKYYLKAVKKAKIRTT